MRHYTLNLRLAAGLVGSLLLSCGSVTTDPDSANADGGNSNSDGGNSNADGSTTVLSLPDCTGIDQVLSTDDNGQLVCKSLPPDTGILPSCQARIQALTTDGTVLSCDDLNTVDATTKTLLDTLTNIEQMITDYTTQLNKLGAGPSAPASYVGLSTTAVTGRITSGALVGIPAATALCAKDFGAGSHMCTVYELYYSAAMLKNLDPLVDIVGGWVYMQSWRHFAASPTEPSAGLADNCAGYTYTFTGADTNQWNGTLFVWNQNVTSVRVPKFYGNTTCDSSHPIACCR